MPMLFTLAGSDGTARPLTVPTSWQDVTLGQMLRLRSEPDTPRLCVLTDLTADELTRIAPPDLLYFSNCLEFLGDQQTLAELLTLLLPSSRG